MRHDTILTSTPNKGAAPSPMPGNARISAKMRKAMVYRVEEGLTIIEATEKAGLSEAIWYKNFKRPEYHDALNLIKAQYVQRVNQLRDAYKAQALVVGLDLMHNSKDERIRARMVEFFASEAKAPTVQVTVNTDNNGKYAYARPGQRIVDIEADDAETDDDKGD